MATPLSHFTFPPNSGRITPMGASSSTSSDRERDRKGSVSSSLSPHQQPSRNPVSLRLYKILSTNFDDRATREALQTLSELYATSSGAGTGTGTGKASERNSGEDFAAGSSGGGVKHDSDVGAQQTVSKDQDQDDELHDEQELGTGIGWGGSGGTKETPVLVETIPGESAARARKNLRRDMEAKLAEGSRKFLEALGEVDEKLSELQVHVSAMRTSCDEAETQLALTNESAKTLLERAGNLRDQRQEVEDKKTIITLFLGRFTLTDAEVEAIVSRDVPVGPRFFDALDKTERIREDCRVLMSGEGGPTKAGLEIMSSTSNHLEQGYEKILRYCSNEFRQVGKDAQVEVGADMREAVSRLRKRPELLTEALTSLTQTRQTSLTSSFLSALTRGGPSGYPRPIEIHAHDPMRYVGDMLAWVHQGIAQEREFLEGIFGMKGDGRMVGSVRKFAGGGKNGEEKEGEKKKTEEEEKEEWVRELMDAIVGKLCVPLKVRVQQTIRSQESSIVSYKIANLLQFYLMTMQRTIGEQAVLSVTLTEITDTAYKVFYDSIETHSQALGRLTLDLDDPSLTPPLPLLDHAQVLREVLSVYGSSLLGDEDEKDVREGIEQVLDVMLDPVIQMCVRAAEEKARASAARMGTRTPGSGSGTGTSGMIQGKWDSPIFVLNCFCYIQSVLSAFEFTKTKREQIEELIDDRIRVLTEEHTTNVMKDAGLYEVIETCKNHTSNEPLSRIPATQPAALQNSLQHFASWLSGLEVVHSPRLSQLTVQKLSEQIHGAALKGLARGYKALCEAVRREDSRYEAAETLLGSERPFGQVGLLWQVFGLEESESSDEEEDEESEESEEEGEDESDSEDSEEE